MSDARVVFVDDEEHLRLAVEQGMDLAGLSAECHASADGVAERLSRDFHGVVVTDIKMPGIDGIALMQRVLEIDPALPVVLVTGHGDVPMAVEAMRAGAYDFIEKPFDMSHLADVVSRAIEKRRLVLENRALRDALGDPSGLETVLVGNSPVMVDLRRNTAAIAEADADALIVGETGSGKEVVARALHSFGPRGSGPFVAINCGALPAEIIESELFGHEAGAFTGAVRQRVGKLEHADGGTVFLDEIESMPLDLQVKLLRVIEERSIVRVGANTPRPVDVRFLAATKADLDRASNEGRFRQDLFYRLNVVALHLPPLRERKEDIPLLFHHLLREARARYRREIPEIGDGLLAGLVSHDWPGNVRELRNAADRFVLQLGEVVPGPVAPEATDASSAAIGNGRGPLSTRLDAFEKNVLTLELARNRGNLKATYEHLGLSRKTLYDKLRKHGLKREDFLSNGSGNV